MTPRLSQLEGGVPVALLPVRIETRFADDARTLRIRIYPDALHVHTHEEALTDDELAAGRLYWRERFTAAVEGAPTTPAWRALAARFGPRRARWIVHATTPRNIAKLGTPASPTFGSTPRKDAPWTRAAYAALMPDRWVAIGIRDGREIFRSEGEPVTGPLSVGPDPTDDAPPPGDALPIDEAMRWVTDYDEAVKRGMAITVRDADVAGGLDRLIVLGVKTGTQPADTASAMSDLLRAHIYTGGLDALRPGAPTNNTEAARVEDPDPVETLTAALDPEVTRTLEPTSGARRLERALGLETDAAHLGAMPLAGLDEQTTASLLVDILWPATFGHYLDVLLDPLVSDATGAQLRAFARASLRPGGPLPVLRVGKQPYGVLPVIAPAGYAGSGIEAGVQGMLQRLRPFWRSAVTRVPRLGATDDADTELLQLLQHTPLSATARFRRLIGPELEPNTQGLETHALAQQYYATLLTRLALGFASAPRIASFTADPRAYPLRVPWTPAAERSEEAPPEPNMLAKIAQMARADDARATLDTRSHGGSLLEALVAQAILTEIDAAIARVVHQHQVRIGAIDRTTRFILRAPEIVRLEGPTPPPPNPGAPGPVAVASARDIAQLILPAVTGADTVAVWVAKTLRASNGNPPAALRDLAAFMDALDALALRPAAQVDRALRGILDAFSHRLDAWCTAVATTRLDALRPGTPGLHVGGFGYVEDLRPDTTPPDSLGYVHAPSLEQAAAAALLRSGHLAHRDAEHQALNIDLRSDRVRLALGLLEGVAQGQPLAALLGYRLERGLRDRDPRLARFIARFRQLAPLRPPDDATVTSPAESIAARDVVDGVALLERWRAGESALLAAVQVPASERAAVADELRRLDDALDAVSDVLVAESVFQMTAGNAERARAALAVLDRQERPVEPQFVRTQRDGDNYAQRLLVLLMEDTPPPAWRPMNDARAAAEPRLNAWCARMIGDPGAYRVSARIDTDDAAPRAVQVQLRQLGLSALSLVIAARRGGADQPSELEERIAQIVAASITAGDVNPRIEIDAEGAASRIGLAPLLVLLEWLGRVTSRRPLTALDLAPPGAAPDEGLDVRDVAARADAAVAGFDAALAALDTALNARRPNERTLRTALDRASKAGAPHALPRAILAANGAPADAATALAALLELGAEVRARMAATRATHDALPTPAPEAGSRALADHHVARIRTLFGADFPVLPRIAVTNAADLAASAGERSALCNGDALAPIEWLQRMALVRPETDALQKLLDAVELLGGTVSSDDLHVVQLPHVPGQRWTALPRAPDAPPTADVAIVIHSAAPIDFAGPFAGLVCDEWAETIPAAEQVTGMSFHFDAPGARAPNSVLLAVPGNANQETWSFDELVDVVNEAAELARMRMVGPRELGTLGTLLPTTLLPDNFRRDVPSVDLSKLTARAAAATAILGKTR